MELIDVYNDNGERTGKVVSRDYKESSFKDGEHIAVATIYIENEEGKFLIQKTSKQKGGIYSATSGHVLHNEEPIDTIKREVKEELGIDISKDKITYLGIVVVNFPVRFIFYLKKNIDIKDIILQKSEVESISYMSLDEIKSIIENGQMHQAHSKILEKVLEYKNGMQ